MTRTPYHTRDGITLYHGDALDILRDLPSASVDAVIADPPYSSGGMYRGDRALQSSGAKYVSTGARIVGPLFTGDNRDQRSWAYWCALWLGECLRISRPGALLVMFTDWRQLPSASDAVQAGGWVWRGIWPWVKPTHRSRPVAGGFWNQSEYALWASNGPMRKDYTECLPGVVYAASPPAAERIHITQKPDAVFDLCARAAPPGGLILDPFTGGGGMLVAARRMGRRAIGIEINAEYCARAVEHLDRAERQGDQMALDEPTGLEAPASN